MSPCKFCTYFCMPHLIWPCRVFGGYRRVYVFTKNYVGNVPKWFYRIMSLNCLCFYMEILILPQFSIRWYL